jgi:hypothetical protein
VAVDADRHQVQVEAVITAASELLIPEAAITII